MCSEFLCVLSLCGAPYLRVTWIASYEGDFTAMLAMDLFRSSTAELVELVDYI